MPVSRFSRFGSALLRLAASGMLVSAFIPVSEARLPLPPTASAAGFTVNNVSDLGDGTCDGTCTLRDAILAANSSTGADTIDFSLSGTIVLGSALPPITDTLTIDGSGPVTVDGNNAFRVFSTTAPLTLTALTVQNGSATGNGGGAYFGGPTTLSGTTFRNNAASNGSGGGAYYAAAATVSGGSFIDNSSSGSFGHGGGAYFGGATLMDGTIFISNTAIFGNGGGAAFYGPATLTSTVFTANSAAFNGGGAFFEVAAALASTTLTSNTADTSGGAHFADVATLTGTAFTGNTAEHDGGGAIFKRTSTVTDTTFISNTAGNSAGGARFDEMTAIIGALFTGNAANSNGGGGAVVAGSNSSIESSRFLANTTGDSGGGVYILSATNVTLAANRFLDNQATHAGGGLYLTTGAQANLENNLLAANTVLMSTGAAEIELDAFDTHLTGRHNTLVSTVPGTGLALHTGPTTTVSLTNTIFDGYAVGVQAGQFAATIALDGVLWSSVTSASQGVGVTVTNAFTGLAAFSNPAAHDYHLTLSSAARDVGVNTILSVDFEGDPRPIGSAPDPGADEYQPVAPVARDDMATTLANQPITLEVLANDSDENGDSLFVTAVGVPTSGTAVISGTAQIVYMPAAGGYGPQVFTYIVSDTELTATAEITVTVVDYRLFLPLLTR